MAKTPQLSGRKVFSLIQVIALTVSVFAASAASLQALADNSGGDGTLRDIGTMPSGTSMDTKTGPGVPILRMLVDPVLNLGMTLGGAADGTSTFFIYDLQSLKTIGEVKEPAPGFYFGLNPQNAALDPVNHRVYFPPGGGGMESGNCPLGPSDAMSIRVFDIVKRMWSQLRIACTGTDSTRSDVDKGTDQFRIQGLSYFAPEDKLYAVGVPQGEWAARSILHQSDTNGQTLLLREMNGTTGQLSWEIDLRPAGCDRLIEKNSQVAFVGRHGNFVYAYCYGQSTGPKGSPGYFLRVELENGKPKVNRNSAVRATPALPNDLFPMMDEGSGRILLLTTGAANGNAVWVYDGANERFYGVIASGVTGETENGLTTYSGLNTHSGRAYLFTSGSLLLADARHSPLPAGLSYPILDDLKGQGSGAMIAVAPKVRRVFIPVKGRGFAVIQDNVPEPVDPPPLDPDRGTADVPEVSGKTGSVFSGASTGFGAHLLLTGGASRVINNLDPICSSLQFLAFVEQDAQGRCLGEQLFSAGNRELFIAATQLEMGSETGVSAQASGGAFARSDYASDADFKRMGSCQSDYLKDRSAGFIDEGGKRQIEGFCAGTPLPVFSDGTRGSDGSGFPIPGSECEDFGSGSKSDSQRPEPVAARLIGSSSVNCDAANHSVGARASAAGLALPDTAEPIISMGRSSSTSTIERRAEGVLTRVRSVANGVVIGPYRIGEIATEVRTLARGRTGTTDATFTRTISEVEGPGYNCKTLGSSSPCDYATFVDTLNQAFGLRVRVSLPADFQLESPRGYQSLVLKDPALRDSERASNNDETFTVSGLQIVFYNDGSNGRNRLVLQLAGVQAESRYGIYLLPEESDAEAFDDLLSLDDVLQDLGSFGELPSSGEETFLDKAKRVAGKALTYPLIAARDALRLIVTNPREFGVLFAMWALLASPVYLAIRRRTAVPV